jgi:hypothetical protein
MTLSRKVILVGAVACAAGANCISITASQSPRPGPPKKFALVTQVVGPVVVAAGRTASYDIYILNVSRTTVPLAQLRLPASQLGPVQIVTATKGLKPDPTQGPGSYAWVVRKLKPHQAAFYKLTILVPKAGPPPPGFQPGSKAQHCLTVASTVDLTATGNVGQSCAEYQ